MNSVWNLDPIYHGFDDPAFEADLAQLKDQVEKLSALTGTLSQMDALDGLKQGIAIQEDITRLAGKLALYAELRQAADTRDTAASSQMGRILAACSASAAPAAAFQAPLRQQPGHRRHDLYPGASGYGFLSAQPQL